MKAYMVKVTVTWPSGEREYFLSVGSGGQPTKDTVYTVTMMPISDNGTSTTSKIPLIKELRWCLQLGLKEAKDLVDNAPSVLARGVSQEEANALARVIRPLMEVRVIAHE